MGRTVKAPKNGQLRIRSARSPSSTASACLSTKDFSPTAHAVDQAYKQLLDVERVPTGTHTGMARTVALKTPTAHELSHHVALARRRAVIDVLPKEPSTLSEPTSGLRPPDPKRAKEQSTKSYMSWARRKPR